MSRTTSIHKAEAPDSLNFVVIVCSSSRYEQLKTLEHVDDPSGDLLEQTLIQNGHTVTFRAIVPDEDTKIKHIIQKTLESNEVDVIITCGGTGISPTDITIEIVQPFLEKEIKGFGEILRMLSYDKIGSAAILTRAIGGVSKGKAIFCLPGSPQAVTLSLLKLILPEVGHIIKHARDN